MDNILKTSIFAKVGVPKLRSFLDLTAFRHKLTSGNLANVITPGYKAKDVDFQAELKRVSLPEKRLTGMMTNDRHIQLGQGGNHSFKILESKEPLSNGMSNVNVDKEIAAMAMNQLNFSIGARMMQRKFTALRKAISGRI